MPSWMPENNKAMPSDDKARSLKKWNQRLYELHGDQGPPYFPEGSLPLPGDSKQRSREKINALLRGAS